MTHTIYRKNDNAVEWTWMKEASDGEYINDGTVSFTLYSGYALNAATGALLPSTATVNVIVHGPVAMAYVIGSDGKYQGKLPASLALDLSKSYTIEINATAGGHVARRSIAVSVVDRIT